MIFDIFTVKIQDIVKAKLYIEKKFNLEKKYLLLLCTKWNDCNRKQQKITVSVFSWVISLTVTIIPIPIFYLVPAFREE